MGALASGSRIGAYEISALIGVGGMGEVYRARDTKLGRDVAVKFLGESFVQDPDRNSTVAVVRFLTLFRTHSTVRCSYVNAPDDFNTLS